jgi:hypothetical protein
VVLVIWTYSLVPSKAVAVSGSPLIAPATPSVGAFRYRPGFTPLPSTARGMMRKLSMCIPVVLDAETVVVPLPSRTPARPIAVMEESVTDTRSTPSTRSRIVLARMSNVTA